MIYIVFFFNIETKKKHKIFTFDSHVLLLLLLLLFVLLCLSLRSWFAVSDTLAHDDVRLTTVYKRDSSDAANLYPRHAHAHNMRMRVVTNDHLWHLEGYCHGCECASRTYYHYYWSVGIRENAFDK